MIHLNEHVIAHRTGHVNTAADHVVITNTVILRGRSRNVHIANVVLNVETVQGSLRPAVRVVRTRSHKAATACVTANVPVRRLVASSTAGNSVLEAGRLTQATNELVVAPLHEPAVTGVLLGGAANEHVAGALNEPACTHMAGLHLVQGVLTLVALVEPAGGRLKLGLRSVNLDTRVGAEAHVCVRDVNHGELVICRAGGVTLTAAQRVADRLTDQQALAQGLADADLVNLHALIVQAQDRNANGGVPDFDVGQGGHCVRLTGVSVRNAGVEDDARNVVDGLGVLLQENLVALRIQRQVVLVGADEQVTHAHTHGLVLVGATAHGGGVATGVENAGAFVTTVLGGGNTLVGESDDSGCLTVAEDLDAVLHFDEGVGDAVHTAGNLHRAAALRSNIIDSLLDSTSGISYAGGVSVVLGIAYVHAHDGSHGVSSFLADTNSD